MAAERPAYTSLTGRLASSKSKSMGPRCPSRGPLLPGGVGRARPLTWEAGALGGTVWTLRLPGLTLARDSQNPRFSRVKLETKELLREAAGCAAEVRGAGWGSGPPGCSWEGVRVRHSQSDTTRSVARVRLYPLRNKQHTHTHTQSRSVSHAASVCTFSTARCVQERVCRSACAAVAAALTKEPACPVWRGSRPWRRSQPARGTVQVPAQLFSQRPAWLLHFKFTVSQHQEVGHTFSVSSV